MIEVPTVFILGAGASMPYGYPSGNSLVIYILHETKSDSPLRRELIDLGFSVDFINEFNKSLSRSRRFSIDAFLEHWPKFREIGKIAIADILSRYEGTSLNKFGDFSKTDDWYRYLFDKMNTSFDEFDKNQVSFITFNYDRSLEYYLFDALKHSYEDTNEKECASKMKNIPIAHMYGKLDHLPWEQWEKGNKRKYGIVPTGAELKKTSSGINIIHEYSDNTFFLEAEDLLKQARRVYFMGLNLLSLDNLNRLNIIDLVNENKVKYLSFCGTAYGLEEREKSTIKRYFWNQRLGKSKIRLGSQKEDSLLFLRKFVQL